MAAIFAFIMLVVLGYMVRMKIYKVSSSPPKESVNEPAKLTDRETGRPGESTSKLNLKTNKVFPINQPSDYTHVPFQSQTQLQNHHEQTQTQLFN